MSSSPRWPAPLRSPASWRCSGCCFTPAKRTGIIRSTRFCVTIDELPGVVSKPRVRVFLDDDPQPILDRELPTDVTLDTRDMQDGPHRLTIRAEDQNGRE